MTTTPASRLHAVRLRSPAIPALLVVFRGPRSFTGQDAAELQLPGHPALLPRVVARAVDAGARAAEPGEFTFRAFVAGKLDLTRAEGVAATIAAESDGQLRAAAALREGRLAGEAQSAVDRLATLLALTEAGIDFVDQEGVVPIAPAALLDGVEAVRGALGGLLSRSRPWAAATALPRVVLVGPPSSGKSTLFNALLGRDRAVIDPMPGTTRDALCEPVTIGGGHEAGVEAMLVDVAGLDTPTAALDRAAQAAARREIERASLLIVLHDSVDAAAMPVTAGVDRPTIAVRSKCDLDADGPTGAIRVSGVTGEGLDALRGAIRQALVTHAPGAGAETLALLPRHEQALREAVGALNDAAALLAPQRDTASIAGVELVADRLRAALDALAALGGAASPDDVVGRVFASFCVGK